MAAASTEKLPSGVVVEHLVQGTGAQPAATDVVKVNYRGTLANGTEFDASGETRRSGNVPAEPRDSVLDAGRANHESGRQAQN